MYIITIHYIAKLKIIHLYNNTTILRFQVFLSFLYIEWEMLHSLAFVYLRRYFLNAELHFIQHFYFESIAVAKLFTSFLANHSFSAKRKPIRHQLSRRDQTICKILLNL